jgi:hypothetical protein
VNIYNRNLVLIRQQLFNKGPGPQHTLPNNNGRRRPHYVQINQTNSRFSTHAHIRPLCLLKLKIQIFERSIRSQQRPKLFRLPPPPPFLTLSSALRHPS